MINLNFEIFFFFFFSSIALTSAVFVIYSKNTVYSVFFLILVFISATGLLLTSNVEFLALMLIIIYVGAITVLFLFVVMMLDINISKIKNNNFGYIPIIFLTSFLFFIEVFLVYSKTFTSYFLYLDTFKYKLTYFKLSNFWTRYPSFYGDISYQYNCYINKLDNITNIETIGQILYTYYAFFLLSAGLILLIALIGAVTLTNKEKLNKKYLTKDIYQQLSRNYIHAVYNIKKIK